MLDFFWDLILLLESFLSQIYAYACMVVIYASHNGYIEDKKLMSVALQCGLLVITKTALISNGKTCSATAENGCLEVQLRQQQTMWVVIPPVQGINVLTKVDTAKEIDWKFSLQVVEKITVLKERNGSETVTR